LLTVIFTLDYEIYGNGDGSPHKLIIEPTDRILKLFEKYDARLTIMADMAEIIKFRDYRDSTSVDLFNYNLIENQLKYAIGAGHDVQLHLHPSFFNSVYECGSWKQDYAEYDLTSLSFDRMDEIISLTKTSLENLLRQVDPDYKCYAFRAANWSMQPSDIIVRVLKKNGFIIDTSVFKYGKRNDLVKFDYSKAHDDIIPWPVSENDICMYDETSTLFEIPIYCENKHIFSFLSANRIIGSIKERFHKLDASESVFNAKNNNEIERRTFQRESLLPMLTKKHPRKMDFNKCTGKQLIESIEKINKKYRNSGNYIPLVMIGHSKLFNKINEKALEPFLEFVAENNSDYSFGTFKSIDMEYYKGKM